MKKLLVLIAGFLVIIFVLKPAEMLGLGLSVVWIVIWLGWSLFSHSNSYNGGIFS